MVFLANMKQRGMQFLSFLFSYKGRINRLKYFLGLLLVKLISFSELFIASFWVVLLLEMIFVYIGFALIQKRCRDIHKNAGWFVVIIGSFYILATFYNALPLQGNVYAGSLVGFVSVLALIFGFYLVFKPGQEGEVDDKNTALLRYPLVTTIVTVGIIVAAIICGRIWFKQHQSLFEASAAIYSHRYSYAMVCHQYGYDLKEYPQKFTDFFHDDIKKISEKLKKYGFNLFPMLDHDRITALNQEMYVDLNKLRRYFILNQIAAEQNVSFEKVQWLPEYNDKMSMLEVCRTLDEKADDFLIENQLVRQLMEQAGAD